MHTSVFHILDLSKYADVVFFVYNIGILIICHIVVEHAHLFYYQKITACDILYSVKQYKVPKDKGGKKWTLNFIPFTVL